MEREYKDSGIEWIGRIPKEWEIDIAKHVFRQRRDKGNEECQLLAATQKYGMYPQHLLGGVVKVAADTDLGQFKTVHKNDYVISLRSFQGGFEMSDFEGVCSPAYQVFFATRPINNQYFKYLFKSDAFIQQINSLTVGIREGKNILYDDFALMPIPIPTVYNQQRIADYLDKKCGEIDGLISLQEQMIEQLTAYKQSVITEAVTKGLNPKAHLVPSGIDWIGDVPEGWRINKLNRIFKIIGSGTTPNSSNNDLYNGTINWIQSGDINGDSLHEAKNKISEETLNKYSALSVYKAPFIIVAMYGASVGNISISEIDGCVNQACCVFSKSDLSFKYAFYAIKSAQKYLIYRAVGGGQPNISQNTLRQLWIPEPPFYEQQAISEYLDTKCAEIDILIALKQKKIETLKDYKKSIIYEAVTGKITID